MASRQTSSVIFSVTSHASAVSGSVIGASPGGFGTILSQNAWLPVLRTLGTRHWAEGRLMVSRVNNVFDEQGELTDEATRDQLRKFLHGFASFVATQRSGE